MVCAVHMELYEDLNLWGETSLNIFLRSTLFIQFIQSGKSVDFIKLYRGVSVMIIRINLRGPIARNLDSGEIFFELKQDSRIRDALVYVITEKELENVWGSVEEMNQETMILHNEVDISLLEGLDTPLSDKDTLTILPLIHGGHTNSAPA
ncbi:MAG: hypothetical protein GF411_04845 [Candidatus Lokiarchaeota archaeon]|nr:hypothetical protein [Candidatus Lokiarchaeota archaeon]